VGLFASVIDGAAKNRAEAGFSVALCVKVPENGWMSSLGKVPKMKGVLLWFAVSAGVGVVLGAASASLGFPNRHFLGVLCGLICGGWSAWYLGRRKSS